MSKLLKKSLHKTSLSFLTLTIMLVFSFTLSGCGGGGGPEPIPRELTLLKGEIDRIQELERANNSDDDVARDILQATGVRPRGRTSTTSDGQPIIASTTQDSTTSDVVSTRTITFLGEYDSDGTLQIEARVRVLNTGQTGAIRTGDQDASVSRQEGFPAPGWTGVSLQSKTSSRYHHTEFYSDIEDNADADYLFMGFWISERIERSMTSSNYHFIFGAGGTDPFDESNAKLLSLTGTATYEGPAIGLYMKKEDAAAAPELDYFNAKASLTADFSDAAAPGAISGTISEGVTDGGESLPGLTLESTGIKESGSGFGGWISGDTSGDGLAGKWGGRFFGNGENATDHPGAVAGTFGAKSTDDLQAIVGTYGAYKQE